MYKIINDFIILNKIENTFIPVDNENEDYKKHLQWISEGNIPEAADPLPPLKLTCTRRQGRLALLQAGYLAQVENHINSIEDPTQAASARIEYEADTWESTNPFVINMWSLLGAPPEGLNILFDLAVTL